MLARIRTTTLPHTWLLAVILSSLCPVLSSGCGASKADVKSARNSGYDTDFSIVYDAALSAVRKNHPHLIENATSGVIKTAWHPTRATVASDGPNQASTPINGANQMNGQMNGGNQLNRGVPVQQRKLYFVRFTVRVVGGDPWRVRVTGEASEWANGGVPSPLYGAAIPPWLEGRTNAIRVRIHKSLKKYRVPLKSTAVVEKKAPEIDVEVDQSYLGNLPPNALAVVVSTLGAAKERDFKGLQKLMHPEFTWSLGAEPSAQLAVMMWQADSSVLEQLVAVLEAGCVVEDSKEAATCPTQFRNQPDYQGYRARFEKRDEDSWVMRYFVNGQ